MTFLDAAANSDHHFMGSVTQVTFGSTTYRWRPKGANGFPDPDGPPGTSVVQGGTGVVHRLPKASVTVLRGVLS